MSVTEQFAQLSTSLIRRFETVRAGRPIESIAPEVGIGHVTIYAWLAQDRATSIYTLTKIERWVEKQEQAQATNAAARAAGTGK